jgi:hypothetical protein
VFRTGDHQVIIDKDSGRECLHLSRRPYQAYTFGSAIRGPLEEGGTFERMHWHHHLGAHIAQQRGVSGNEDVGCASIFVAGKREDGLGGDRRIPHIEVCGVYHQWCACHGQELQRKPANPGVSVFSVCK